MSESRGDVRTDRRRFLMWIGWTGVASAVAGRTPTLAQADTGATPSSPPASPPLAAGDAGEKPISAEALALTNVVKLRHGGHLTEAELQDVARDLDDRLEYGRALHDVRLGSDDEPDVTFRA